MYFVNNELMNDPDPERRPDPVAVPDAEVMEDTPFTATFEFCCTGPEHLAHVEVFLTSRRASALMSRTGGRVYLKATSPIDANEGEFPRRVAIPVQIIDDPGSAIPRRRVDPGG